MAYLSLLLIPLAIVGGFVLGVWLKKHPGHPVLEAIYAAEQQAVRNAKLGQAAAVLQSLGIMPAATIPAATAPGPATPPPTAATK